jgi:Ni,Fe-hydrogenase maturation factor
MAEDLHKYRQVIFVDAHTGAIEKDIAFEEILPEMQNSPFTHHLSAQMMLSITQTIYGIVPHAFLLSIRAYEFQFSRDLSTATAELCDQAIELLWKHLS